MGNKPAAKVKATKARLSKQIPIQSLLPQYEHLFCESSKCQEIMVNICMSIQLKQDNKILIAAGCKHHIHFWKLIEKSLGTKKYLSSKFGNAFISNNYQLKNIYNHKLNNNNNNNISSKLIDINSDGSLLISIDNGLPFLSNSIDKNKQIMAISTSFDTFSTNKLIYPKLTVYDLTQLNNNKITLLFEKRMSLKCIIMFIRFLNKNNKIIIGTKHNGIYIAHINNNRDNISITKFNDNYLLDFNRNKQKLISLKRQTSLSIDPDRFGGNNQNENELLKNAKINIYKLNGTSETFYKLASFMCKYGIKKQTHDYNIGISYDSSAEYHSLYRCLPVDGTGILSPQCEFISYHIPYSWCSKETQQKYLNNIINVKTRTFGLNDTSILSGKLLNCRNISWIDNDTMLCIRDSYYNALDANDTSLSGIRFIRGGYDKYHIETIKILNDIFPINGISDIICELCGLHQFQHFLSFKIPSINFNDQLSPVNLNFYKKIGGTDSSSFYPKLKDYKFKSNKKNKHFSLILNACRYGDKNFSIEALLCSKTG